MASLSFNPLMPMIAAMLLAWPAAASSAPPPPGATAAAASRMDKAMKLAQTVQPREMVVEQALAVLDKQVVESLLTDPGLRQAETEHPGLVRAMWLAAKPIIQEELVKSLPDLWKGMAGIYARHMSSAQLDEVTRFFEGPTGRKFLLETNRNVDIAPMARDAMRTDGGDIGKDAFLESVSEASNAAAAAMTNAERREFELFMGTTAGRMLEKAAPDVSRFGLEWMNRDSPEMDARIEAAMAAAIEKVLGADSAPASKPAPPLPTAG
jgi:hypothetical protein